MKIRISTYQLLAFKYCHCTSKFVDRTSEIKTAGDLKNAIAKDWGWGKGVRKSTVFLPFRARVRASLKQRNNQRRTPLRAQNVTYVHKCKWLWVTVLHSTHFFVIFLVTYVWQNCMRLGGDSEAACISLACIPEQQNVTRLFVVTQSLDLFIDLNTFHPLLRWRLPMAQTIALTSMTAALELKV